jgi:multidrug efflux pump subunit AcrA (membrane-fusion protein)
MTQAKQSSNKGNSRPRWLIGLGVVVVLLVAGVLFGPRLLSLAGVHIGPAGSNQASAIKTARVTSVTAVTTVTSAGPVAALQSGLIYWKTTGTVTQVSVKAGAHVHAGDVLMSLDPLSTPQIVIQAQADLIASKKALDDLLHPSALTIASAAQLVKQDQDHLNDLVNPKLLAVANARQALATAENNLYNAQKTLSASKNLDIKTYQEQVQSAQVALTNAQQNAAMVDVSNLQVQLRNAQTQLQTATNVYNNAKDAFAKCPTCLTVYAYNRTTTWQDAVNQYNDAVNQVQVIQTQIDQAQRGGGLNITAAQDNLDKAQRNLAWALQGPTTQTVGVNEAAVLVAQGAVADAQDKLNTLLKGSEPTDVAVAEASLADAQDKLYHLLNGPAATDLATAQARVLAGQATVNGITLTAPFDGDVLAVNYQPGDSASLSQPAIVLADRSLLRVDAQVDEADISQIRAGNAVSITLEALPSQSLNGKVEWINTDGTTVQGLVKYTVRIDLAAADPRALLGMTANVSIVTDQQAGALAVPLDAVQLDQQGEYVNRVRSGVVERVKVVSGQIQSDVVVVTGALQPGDEVQLIPPKASAAGFARPGGP